MVAPQQHEAGRTARTAPWSQQRAAPEQQQEQQQQQQQEQQDNQSRSRRQARPEALPSTLRGACRLPSSRPWCQLGGTRHCKTCQAPSPPLHRHHRSSSSSGSSSRC
jgi:hypothetical protein